jgi:uncharacterized protein YbjT (DUF2867 family)
MTSILVTGATGTVGSAVVAALADRPDVTIRAGTRSPQPGGAGNSDKVKQVVFDWFDQDTIESAVDGVERVFLLSPVIDERQVEAAVRLLDAARGAGVQAVVKLSTFAPDREPATTFGRWHLAVEEHLKNCGLAYTILRPGSYLDNYRTYFRPDAGGIIYRPIGDAVSADIDVRDIADVAVRALTTDDHAGAVYELSGPQAITGAEVAEELSAACSRPIQFVPVPEEAARGAMLGAGLAPWYVDAVLEFQRVIREGYTSEVLDTVPRITGRPGRSLADVARHHSASWVV